MTPAPHDIHGWRVVRVGVGYGITGAGLGLRGLGGHIPLGLGEHTEAGPIGITFREGGVTFRAPWEARADSEIMRRGRDLFWEYAEAVVGGGAGSPAVSDKFYDLLADVFTQAKLELI